MEPKKRSIPMTDGTPVACRQKNAQEFLAGHVPGVMAQYGLGLFGPAQQQHSPRPRRPRRRPRAGGLAAGSPLRLNIG